MFEFLAFPLHFMLDPGPNPVPEAEPECITVLVLLWQKVTVSAVPVPQHCFWYESFVKMLVGPLPFD
jgi:hypothetical protein